jgi:hypothetical protein
MEKYVNSIIQTSVALVMMLASCSFGMRGVDPSWDRTKEPDCTDSYIPVVVDGMTASVVSGVVAQNQKEGKYPLDTSVVVASLLVSLVYTASAVNGARKYNECRLVKADWYAREAIRVGNADAEARSRSAPNPPAAPNSSIVAPPQVASTTSALQATTTAVPGFFCTSTPPPAESNICMRDHAACEHARKSLNITDGEDCVPRSIAWCFDGDGQRRCFATQRACEVQVEKSVAVSIACVERS